MGVFKGLKFGAKYTDHNRELTFNATTYGGFFNPFLNAANPIPSACQPVPCAASNFAGGLTPGTSSRTSDGPATVAQYWQVNRSAVESILFHSSTSRPRPASGRIYYPQQNFSVNEKTYGGYVMGDFEGGGWRGNVGVRIVRTEQESNGNLITNDPNAIPEPVRKLHSDHRRSFVHRYAPQSQHGVQHDRRHPPALLPGTCDDAAGLQRDRTAYEPEPGLVERHFGQSRARSFPRQPGGPVDRVVSGCRQNLRRRLVLQGRQVLHHGHAGHGVLQRAIGHLAEPAVHAGESRMCSTARSSSISAPMAVAEPWKGSSCS